MKANRINAQGATKRAILVTLGIILLTALVVGICITYSKLHDIWVEQCEIVDVAKQVRITTGQYIKEGVILEKFGLRKGANLALIDFRKKREEILGDVPNIREMKIERHLPERVEILVEERVPIARLWEKDSKTLSYRVVDSDGVVFDRARGTGLLPIIYESPKSVTPIGKRLTGRARAALSLLELARTAPFTDMPILGADTTPTDFILSTLGNYDKAKIAWTSMDEPTATTQECLTRQLRHLHDAFTTGIARTSGPTPHPVSWNAVIPGKKVYANTKEPIQ